MCPHSANIFSCLAVLAAVLCLTSPLGPVDSHTDQESWHLDKDEDCRKNESVRSGCEFHCFAGWEQRFKFCIEHEECQCIWGHCRDRRRNWNCVLPTRWEVFINAGKSYWTPTPPPGFPGEYFTPRPTKNSRARLIGMEDEDDLP